ncbi:MAG: hypothetical protein E6Q97_05830 [Desulfurellales bacterium]|nr:MAG: hypothetical protein E6Q97_05830 [Desulfurellales bacterium]
MNDSPDQSSTLTLTFAPIEAALLKAFATRTNAAKPLASLRPLVWLAWLALAQWFGLAHLITPEMRQTALDLARRPGRRKTEPDGQSSLLNLFPMNDGRPGVYVSFARLAFGNVREQQGDAVLDLVGITDPNDALVRANSLGWVAGPSGNGLRFIPPTIWGLLVDHNSAAFARKGGVDEYIESLSSELASAKERIALLETSIAESARLPIAEPTKDPCPHKSVVLYDGKRNCTACGEPLPEPTNEKSAKFRKNAHTKLTENEEPREPTPKPKPKSSKSPLKKTTKKGRAS